MGASGIALLGALGAGLAGALCMGPAGCTREPDRRDALTGPAPELPPARASPVENRRELRPRSVLIQLDGMPGLWLRRWLRERRFLPDQQPAAKEAWARGGLARLAQGAWSASLRPTEPSLTAPNLASMLTGARPAVHGIVSNRFYRRGKRVSGFTEPVGAELLWQAALRQRRRVVTWLALGTRCAASAPAALQSVCYPRRLSSHGRDRVLVSTEPGPDPSVRHGHLRLRASHRAPGRPWLELRLELMEDESRAVRLGLPAGAETLGRRSRRLVPGDSVGILWSGGRDREGQPAPRRLSFVTLRRVDRHTGRIALTDHGTAVSRAAPATFARTIQDLGLVFPPGADDGALRAGTRPPADFARDALREVRVVSRFARWLGRGDRFDLAVIYLAAVDILGHALWAPAGRAELEAWEVRAYHHALEQALRRVDRQLGAVVDSLDLRRTRILLASDHGLAPVTTDVSLRAALFELDPRIRVVTSGAAGLVHLPPALDARDVAAALRGLLVKDRPVFAPAGVVLARGRPVLTGGRLAWGAALPQMGLPRGAAELFVQAAPGFSLSHRRRSRLADWSLVMATHGHRADHPAMSGMLLASGPGLAHHGELGPLDITEVAALVSQSAGLDPPRQAAPAPLTLWDPTASWSPEQRSVRTAKRNRKVPCRSRARPQRPTGP